MNAKVVLHVAWGAFMGASALAELQLGLQHVTDALAKGDLELARFCQVAMAEYLIERLADQGDPSALKVLEARGLLQDALSRAS